MASTTNKYLNDLNLKLQQGDVLAFNEIYNIFWKPLYHTAFMILNNEDNALDAVQDVFISLWRRKNEVTILNLKSYLHQSVRYTVLKIIKEQKADLQFYKRLAEITTEIIEENTLLSKENEKLVNNLIENLPKDYKEIFLLSRQEEMSYKQIATKLGVSKKTVEKKISICLKLIKSGLNTSIYLIIIFFHSFFIS